MRLLLLLAISAPFLVSPAIAGEVEIQPRPVTEWKAVYGRMEARDIVPARARIGGTVTELLVTEGDQVTPGERIAVVRDDKLAFQIEAIDAQLAALKAQLDRAQNELDRGQTLVDKGVITTQRLDQLRTDVEVTRSQITATEAQRSVVVQQQAEGDVLAPVAGMVLTVPVTKGGVLLAGETVATVGGGGFFLRLAIPERHAASLKQGAAIRVTTDNGEMQGKLAKIYPQIENGRVIADVEVAGLDTAFVDARVLIELPVGERNALLVPAEALSSRFGVDFLVVANGEQQSERAVITGETIEEGGQRLTEVVTGLSAGERVVTP